MKRVIEPFKVMADFVVELTNSISETADSFFTDQALEKIIEICCKLINADSGCILIKKDIGGYKTQVVCDNFYAFSPENRCCEMSDLEPKIDEFIREKEIKIIKLNKDWKNTITDIEEIKYIVWAPLTRLIGEEGKCQGIIKLNFKKEQEWFKEGNDSLFIRGLYVLADHASQIIRAQRHSEEDKRRAELLVSLSLISDLFMQHSQRISDLLPIVTKEVTKLLKAETCAIFLKERSSIGSPMNFLKFNTGYSLKGCIEKSMFNDGKLISTLVNNKLLRIDNNSSKAIFSSHIENDIHLKNELDKIGVFEGDINNVMSAWHEFEKNCVNMLDSKHLPEHISNRSIPICLGGKDKSLSGAVAFRKEKKNLYGSEIENDDDWGGIANFKGYNYLPSNEWHSLLLYPLYVKGDKNALGVIKIENKIADDGNYTKFTTEDETLLNILSMKISIIIQIANLIEVKDEFLRTVSHTLQAPLHPLINSFDEIEELHPNIKDTSAYQELFMHTFRFQRHIDNLLTLSRTNTPANDIKYEKEIYTVKEIVDNIRRLFEFSLSRLHINIDYIIDDPNINLFVDKYYIEEVFINILTNSICAIKAIRRKDESSEFIANILFEVYKVNSDLLFTIEDNGIGIEKGDEKKIFNKFYSGVLSKGSVGIGLEVSKRYVEDHNGGMWFDPT